MQFLFSAPFRTKVNLNSLRSMDAIGEVVQHISSSVDDVTQSLPEGFSWSIPWAKDTEGELHYAELSEDLVPLSATPLFRLHLPTEKIRSIIDQPSSEDSIKLASCNECYVDYYDNTVAILFFDATLSFPGNDEEGFKLLDKWSTDFCSRLISHVKPFENALTNELVSAKRNRSKVFLEPESFTVFFDQTGSHGEKDDTSDKMLWVTRIYVNKNETTRFEHLEEWTQHVDLKTRATKVGQASVAFCVGNSVVLNDIMHKERSALMSAMSICTYFYVLHDVMNRNLKRIFFDLTSRKSAPTSTISKINKTRGHIEFIENEFTDVLLGLQGMRRLVASNLLETWRYSDLVNSVQRKKLSVGKIIDYSLQEKQGKYARAVEAILAAIGGVAILDFALNLFSFANSDETPKDEIPGLTDVAKLLPPDGVLYAIVIILLSILFLVGKKR